MSLARRLSRGTFRCLSPPKPRPHLFMHALLFLLCFVFRLTSRQHPPSLCLCSLAQLEQICELAPADTGLTDFLFWIQKIRTHQSQQPKNQTTVHFSTAANRVMRDPRVSSFFLCLFPRFSFCFLALSLLEALNFVIVVSPVTLRSADPLPLRTARRAPTRLRLL